MRVAGSKRKRSTKVRVKAPPTVTDASSVSIEHLFAEVERVPTDEGATLVLADALAEAGDTRGELFHVQQALSRAPKPDRITYAKREAALIHALRTRLLGRFAPLPDIGLEVRLGFARELSLVNCSVDDLARLLHGALPSTDARLLDGLQIATDSETAIGLGELFRQLAGEVAVPTSLRRLTIGNAFERDPDDRLASEYGGDDDENERETEDLRAVLTMFPRIRELVLDLGVVPVELAPLATNRLESLTWISPRLTAPEIEPLGRSVLPKLRRFELWIGAVYGNDDGEMRDGEEPGDDIDVLSTLPVRDLAPVFAMLDRCTELRELVFGHTTRYGKLLELLRRYRLTKRLHTLGLSQLDLDDGDSVIDFMVENPNIERLVLEDVFAGDHTRRVLARRLGTRLVASYRDNHPRFRYVTGFE
jgi:hypothetical protein